MSLPSSSTADSLGSGSPVDISVVVVQSGPDPPFSVTTGSMGSLKWMIMKRYSLTESDMKQRVLVPDSRDFRSGIYGSFPTLVDAMDLLESEDGSALQHLGLNNGDMLRLGRKNPFCITIMTPTCSFFQPFISRDIPVNPYETVAEFKKKIEKATGEAVTKDNLRDEFFSEGVDNKTILTLGFYALNTFSGPQYSIAKKPKIRYDDPGFKFIDEGEGPNEFMYAY